ncbi:MAG: PfkB family carbohydrate kinase [Clostridia bacterium]|nr:PfkB family carbohydrate kinase [Clostridia bacterium]
MAKYSSMIIGHSSLDHNTDHEGNTVNIVGGAVVFSSASAYALGHNVLAVTKNAEKDMEERRSAFTIPQENIIFLPSEKSTEMVNIYHTADKERRTCFNKSKGDPFKASEIPEADCAIYHLAGLVFGDFDKELIISLAKRGDVAVDVQAMLRHVNPDGTMHFEDWADKKECLPYVKYLKTDAAEAEIMTGCSDRKEAAKHLYSWGAKEIMITHNTEVLIYDGNEFYTCPIKARNLSGRTGRGDTTFAAYINERLNKSIPDALLTATATVSLKMETPGPFKGTREDIENYIKELY